MPRSQAYAPRTSARTPGDGLSWNRAAAGRGEALGREPRVEHEDVARRREGIDGERGRRRGGQDGADARAEQPLGLGLGVPHVEGLDVDRLDDERERPRSIREARSAPSSGGLGVFLVLGRLEAARRRALSAAGRRPLGGRRLGVGLRRPPRLRSARFADSACASRRSSRRSAGGPDPARPPASSSPCLISAPNQAPGPVRGRSAPRRSAGPAGAAGEADRGTSCAGAWPARHARSATDGDDREMPAAHADEILP